jgi:hypothetical protein
LVGGVPRWVVVLVVRDEEKVGSEMNKGKVGDYEKM